MAKEKKRLLWRINAIMVALLGMLGVMSCQSCKYGAPPFHDDPDQPTDSIGLIICKYGVPANLVTPMPED